MKLQLLEKKDLTETEIDIRYSSMTQPLNLIVSRKYIPILRDKIRSGYYE